MSDSIISQGSFKHLAQCMILYGSVDMAWSNEDQKLYYHIPATCLNGFKDEFYELPKDEILKMANNND